MLGAMIDGGFDVFRMNFSHGRPADHKLVLDHTRRRGAGRGAGTAGAQGGVGFAGRARGEGAVAVAPGTREVRLGIALANMVSLTGNGLSDAEAAYTASQDIGLFEALAGGVVAGRDDLFEL